MRGRTNQGEPRVWTSAALIAATGCAAYANSFGGDFQFDDIPAILQNPTLRHLWPLSAALLPPPGALTVSGRPLLNLSFALNYAISGEHRWSYHALNLLIHIGAALLVFGLVRRTLDSASRFPPAASRQLAMAVGLIWVVHPLTTESVTYIVQRAESLAGFFYLLTLYGFVRAEERCNSETTPATSGPQNRHRRFWLMLSVVACLLGTATKEIIVTAPLSVLIFDRIFIGRSWRAAWEKRKLYYAFLWATWIPLLGFVASTGWNRGETSGFNVRISPIHYWLTQGEAALRYIGLSLCPHPLAIDYGPTYTPMAVACVFFALLAAGLIATAIGVARGRAWSFPAAVGCLILAPTSFIPGVLQFVAEHRMYIPLAGVVAGVVIAIYTEAVRLISAERERNIILAAVLVLAVSALGAATALRNRDYRSSLTLWKEDIATRPQSAIGQANVGTALLQEGRTAEGIPYCVRAVELDPMKPAPHYNLGVAYERQDRPIDAVNEFITAAAINPKLTIAQLSAGRLLNRLKRPATAESILRQALAAEPESADGHANLGIALAAEGRATEAIVEFQRSLQIDPAQPEVEFNLGIALSGQGRIDEAIACYTAATRLRPDYGEAWLNRGVTLAQMGHLAEALPALETAVRLRPDSADAHGNLASALDEDGRKSEAIREYRSALRLRPDYAEAHYNLGYALLRAGEIPAARSEFRAALQLKPDFAAAREILNRLALYPGGS